MISTKNKTELRQYALRLRKSIAVSGDLKNKTSVILQKILNSDDFKRAKNIALYFPIKNEIDLMRLLSCADKKFYLPRCTNNELEFVECKDVGDLIIGEYNIPTPAGVKIEPEILDVIYIPALMANKSKYRLGYGKGYYDRFFAKNKISAKKIIVVASELLSNDFVEDKIDIQCDEIISA